MKIRLYLIDFNKLIVSPADENQFDYLQAETLSRQIHDWNEHGRVGVLPCECEIIDMRTPQREEIEAIVNKKLAALQDGIIDSVRLASGMPAKSQGTKIRTWADLGIEDD